MPVVVQAILVLPWLLGFAWVAKQLLGAYNLSAFRTLIAGLAGITVGYSTWPLLNARGLSDDLSTFTATALSVLATMAAIVALEVFSRPRRTPVRRGIPRPLTFIRRRIYQVRRSAEITRIATKRGLGRGFGLATSPSSTAEVAAYGVQLRGALEEAGGLFVKLGQLLANRPDIVPPAVAVELEQLQQDAKPVPREEMEPAIEAAFGAPIDSIFSDFDWEPLGAASIGQVYKATLQTGEDVILKVRRPDIEQRIDRDLSMVLDLARLVEEQSEQAHRFGVTSIADEFAALLREELDYRIEAVNTTRARAAVADNPDIDVPQIFDQYTTESTLVQERVSGRALGRIGSVGGERGRQLADALFSFEVNAMLAGSLFHADPHPGNIFVNDAGTLTLIDFGSVGRLDAFERSAIESILAAIELKDPAMMRAAAIEVGMGGADVDPEQLDRAFARLMADHLADGETPSAEVLIEFMSIAQSFNLRMPTGVSEMMRAVGTLQGTLEVLSPNYPIIDAAKDLASGRVREALAPGNLAQFAKEEAIRLAPTLRRVPQRLDTIADKLEHGRLTLNVSLFAENADARVVTRVTNLMLTTFIGATLGLMSILLYGVEGPQLTDNITLMGMLASFGLLLSIILLLRVLLQVLRDDDSH